jgi:hypothetical protein
MAKTIKFNFEEQQLVLQALNYLCFNLYEDDDRRQMVTELEKRIQKLETTKKED